MPGVSLERQVLRPSVFLSAQHHDLLLTLLVPQDSGWSHGLSGKLGDWSRTEEIVIGIELKFVSNLKHGFILHWPGVECPWASLDDILEVELAETKFS